MNATELKEFARRKEEFIDKSIAGLEKDIAKLQKRLFDELTDKIVTQLNIEAGKLTQSSDNFRAINQLNQLMRDFRRQFTDPLIKGMADNFLKTFAMTDEMYKTGYNVAPDAYEAMKRQSAWVYERIGITPQGAIIPDGYLDRLADMPEVRKQIIDYVTKNVMNNAGVTAFQKGFRQLIEGTPEVPGAIMQYHKQYSFDLFNQADAAVNNVFAKVNGLEYFVYVGSVMKNTRCFCEKRNNKVFHVSDAAKWINDPTLLKGYKEGRYPYNPLIDRGGFNCRHHLQYISEPMAKRMGYSKAKAEEINNEPTC